MQAQFDQASSILDSNSEEVWGETKSVLGSMSKAERGVWGRGAEGFYFILPSPLLPGHGSELASREFKKTTTATATGTSLNKRINEQNNGCARAL